MIEKTVLDYLNRKLDVPVYMEVPEKPEKEYVVIRKNGKRSREPYLFRCFCNTVNFGLPAARCTVKRKG